MRLIKAKSQVFLCDHKIITTIVDYVQTYNRFVFEIGCGGGALTMPLARHQTRLVGVEVDQQWWAKLCQQLTHYPQTLIIHQDVVKMNLGLVLQRYFPKDSSVIILSNLPYHLSKKIIFQLLQVTSLLPDRIDRWVLMMQSELADRFLAQVGEHSYGFLSVIFGYFFIIRQLVVAPCRAFVPRPQVDSKVVVFIPHRLRLTQQSSGLVRFIKQMFKFRRKTVYNNLKSVVGPVVLAQIKKSLPAKLQLRPQDLTFDDFAKLFSQVNIFTLQPTTVRLTPS